MGSGRTGNASRASILLNFLASEFSSSSSSSFGFFTESVHALP
jgi:hypothetical protein